MAFTVGFIPKTQAQELSQLPPIEGIDAAEYQIHQLQHKVRELEVDLAALQEAQTPVLDASVKTTDNWQQADPSSQPIGLTSFANSILSHNYTIDIGGYVKTDLIHDFNAIATTDVFDPLAIPTDGRPGENTRFHARQTRLNLDFRPDADSDDLQLFVETDFFGTTDPFRRSRAFLRLRHSYIRAGRLLAGQTWSTFMDESILPSTLDFESPRSVILDRRGLLRWTQPVTDSLDLAFALEDPRPVFDQASAPAGGIERPAPDLIGRVRHEAPWGHLQSAGLVRMLRYRQDTAAKDDEMGWGFNFTGRVNPNECNSLLFQVAFGEAIESYRQAPDAAVDATGNIEVIPLIAWVVGYEVDWTDRVASTFVYSAGRGTNTAFQLANAPKAAEYLAANIRFELRTRLSCGVEYLYGTRTDLDGSNGEAHRVQFSVRYDIP